MTTTATQYVNVHALVQIGWVGLLAGAGLVAVYAVGVDRVRQARRSGAAAVPYLTLAAVCFVVVITGVALGVVLMLDK